MKQYVIIVAGGSGKRMGKEIPKQFLILGNKPILMHTIQVFYDFNSKIQIILVLPKKHIDSWYELCEKHGFNIYHSVVTGGVERFDSVKNGLKYVDNNSLVAIHDGVRPFVSIEVIERCYSIAKKKGNGIPCIPLTDSIREITNKRNIAIERSLYKSIQTPQVFQSGLIKKAYCQNFNPLFTDDASVLESIGEKINLVDGNTENIKITTAFDIKIAEIILKT